MFDLHHLFFLLSGRTDYLPPPRRQANLGTSKRTVAQDKRRAAKKRAQRRAKALGHA